MYLIEEGKISQGADLYVKRRLYKDGRDVYIYSSYISDINQMTFSTLHRKQLQFYQITVNTVFTLISSFLYFSATVLL